MLNIFISYDSVNKATVDELHTELHEPGTVVFIDRHDINPGDNLSEVVEDNIRGCGHFIVLWSAAEASSPWVNREISWAMEYGKTIIPVALDQTPRHPLLNNILHEAWEPKQKALPRIRNKLGVGETKSVDPMPPPDPSEVTTAINRYKEKTRSEFQHMRILGAGEDLLVEDAYISQTICLHEIKGSPQCQPATLLADSGPPAVLIVVRTTLN